MVIFKTADWDDNAGTHNALAAETKYLNYRVLHKFGEPAEVVVELADPDGTIAKKYDVDAAGDSVWIGPGRAYIEDPDATCFFDGRIVKARYDRENSRVLLYCKDWASQLEDTHIVLDSRVDLSDGTKERAVLAYKRADNSVSPYIGPATTTAGPTYTLWDNESGLTWDDDEFNGKYLVFTGDFSGPVTVTLLPGDETVTPGDAGMTTDDPANGEENVWEIDTLKHNMANDDTWTVDYWFYGAPTVSSLYVADSITKMTLKMRYKAFGLGKFIGGYIQVYDYDAGVADWVMVTLITSRADATYEWQYIEVDITESAYLVQPISDLHRISVRIGTADTDVDNLYVDYIAIDIDCTLNPPDTAYEILDTSSSEWITVGSDLTYNGLGIYNGHTYCIVAGIQSQINTLVTGNDDLMTMTTDVESTSGVSTTVYEEVYPLEIINDYAKQDGAVIWVPLGEKELQYKKTFNAAGTAVTDSNFLKINSEWDYESMYNEAHVYGMKFDDEQVYTTYTDTTSEDTYGATKSIVIKDGGITTEQTADDAGEARVKSSSDVLLYIDVVCAGKSSYVLGTELKYTSVILGLTNEMYVVTQYEYNAATYRTKLRLHPRSSLGYSDYNKDFEEIAATVKKVKLLERRVDASKPTLVGE